jgi:general secretion pathway protein G
MATAVRAGCDAPETRARADLKRLSDAVDLYRLNTGEWPRTLKDLRREPRGVRGWRGPYLRRQGQLRDPWGNAYRYVRDPGAGRAYALRSAGPDGAPGGPDDVVYRD